jgi:hypothetical protein
MYIFGDFAKLIILLLVIAIIFLVFKRLHNRRKEDSEDRNS